MYDTPGNALISGWGPCETAPLIRPAASSCAACATTTAHGDAAGTGSQPAAAMPQGVLPPSPKAACLAHRPHLNMPPSHPPKMSLTPLRHSTQRTAQQATRHRPVQARLPQHALTMHFLAGSVRRPSRTSVFWIWVSRPLVLVTTHWCPTSTERHGKSLCQSANRQSVCSTTLMPPEGWPRLLVVHPNLWPPTPHRLHTPTTSSRPSLCHPSQPASVCSVCYLVPNLALERRSGRVSVPAQPATQLLDGSAPLLPH